METITAKKLTDATIDSFLIRIQNFVNSGGELNVNILSDLAKNHKDEVDQNVGISEALFQHYSAQRSLKRVFDRTLIKRFSHMFPDKPDRDESEPFISRRAIKGLMVAIDRMIGTDMLTYCRDRAKKIVESKISDDDGLANFDWKTLYRDPEANQLCDKILIHITQHFDDFHHRLVWMQKVIEMNMVPARLGEIDEHWEFGEKEFCLIMKYLYRNIAMKIESNRQDLLDEYGDSVVERVELFLAELNLRLAKQNQS